MSRHPLRALALATVVAASAAACDNGAATRSTTSVAPTPTSTIARAGDGVLRIGMLLPTSGAGAAVGRPLTAAVELAVSEINAAGGVLGRAVELTSRDEGATTPLALQSARELLDDGVDVIIGPASSRVALGVMEHVVSTGVATCSPTASSMALDAFPDDGLFFRTVPSDSTQAAALADQIEQTGQPSVAIAFLDDPYGRPFAAKLEADAQSRNMTVVSSVGYSAAADDYSTVADEVLASEPAVVAVIGDASDGMRVLAAIGSHADDSTIFVVNDAMRAPLSANTREQIRPGTMTNIVGVAPTAYSASTEFTSKLGETSGPYAQYAYDCVNLFALAAEQAASDAARQIAGSVAAASSGGSACATFADCAALLRDGRNIDYNGPDGQVEITSDGEAARARFDLFTFDRTGVDQLAGTLPVVTR